ncbi:MAG TPA: hypothetical protein VEU31_07850 [Candidatus Acidoferrales bacterium]|nr:hypothetical protein [Candidatus Acidoferrales bacterium]
MTRKANKATKKISWRRDVSWIAELAEPYLRGYAPVRERSKALDGFWFAPPAHNSTEEKKNSNRGRPAADCGFFVGYLLGAEKYPHLNGETPECLVFATLGEPGNPLHAQLVKPADSLLRKTHTYIGWLTHRPPRFAFFEDHVLTMVRHRTMRDWPEEKYLHYSRNFFIETLAWLVRSGLVRKLAEAAGDATSR